MRVNKYQQGQTLVEALVSLSIAVAVIGAITVVVISSLNNATFTKNQNLATQYAQEGLEVTKRASLSDTPKFSQIADDIYCLDEGKTIFDDPLTNPGEGRCGFNVGTGETYANVGGVFSREIEVDHQNEEPLSSGGCGGNTKVIVRVKWSDNKCEAESGPLCHEVVLESCFSDYDPSNAGSTPI